MVSEWHPERAQEAYDHLASTRRQLREIPMMTSRLRATPLGIGLIDRPLTELAGCMDRFAERLDLRLALVATTLRQVHAAVTDADRWVNGAFGPQDW
ncbi:MAG: hypothetical protein WD358_00850 [Nitriliruptoraceae bacterium]